jgi:hypothetical protein
MQSVHRIVSSPDSFIQVSDEEEPKQEEDDDVTETGNRPLAYSASPGTQNDEDQKEERVVVVVVKCTCWQTLGKKISIHLLFRRCTILVRRRETLLSETARSHDKQWVYLGL